MTIIKDLIKNIEKAKKLNGSFSNSEILSILKATKDMNIKSTSLDNNLILRIKELTTREIQIFSLIGNSKSTKDIAKNLDLSVSTVETHRKNIRRKLDLKGKGKLFEYALLYNLTINKS